MVCTYMLYYTTANTYCDTNNTLQDLGSNNWHVPSMSGTHDSGYIVKKVKDTRVECTDSSVCTRDECRFLCHHMYECSCYDFSNGHLCKHVHRVHSLNLKNYSVSPERAPSESSNEDLLRTEAIQAVDSQLGDEYIPGVTIPTEE